MSKCLPASFYASSDVVQVAKNLLGKTIHTNINGMHTAGRIVETEAYRAPDDKACHAYNNKRTLRTETMFAEGGCAYIYLCYGIHHLFNVVSGKKDEAHAVLIRGIEPTLGIPHMMTRRQKQKLDSSLTAGPGSLSQALGIKVGLKGASLLDPNGNIFITHSDVQEEINITASPRVGVSYAEECATWPWRFRLKNSKWTSPAK